MTANARESPHSQPATSPLKFHTGSSLSSTTGVCILEAGLPGTSQTQYGSESPAKPTSAFRKPRALFRLTMSLGLRPSADEGSLGLPLGLVEGVTTCKDVLLGF